MSFLDNILGRKRQEQPQSPRLKQAQPTQQNQLQVQQNPGMQALPAQYEDAYTPSAALEQTGYINPQTTRHGGFMQEGQQPQQGIFNPQQDPYSALRRLLGIR